MNAMTEEKAEQLIDQAQDFVLARFLPESCGTLESCFTRSIICRNELNHTGSSSATCDGTRIGTRMGSKVEMRPITDNNVKIGYELYQPN